MQLTSISIRYSKLAWILALSLLAGLTGCRGGNAEKRPKPNSQAIDRTAHGSAENAPDEYAALSVNDRLFRACVSGNLGRVKEAMALGARVSGLDSLHRTPLMYAAKFGHKDVVAYLCAQKADVNAKRNIPFISWSSQRWPFLDIEGGTALMDCAMNGDTGIARILLENGAGINDRSALGNTALFYAAQEGNKDMVDLLLGASADVYPANTLNETALSYAVRANQGAVVELLLKNQQRPNPFILAGALCAATDSNNVDLAERLLETGLPSDTPFYHHDSYQVTPLMHAAALGRMEIVQLLLRSGHNINGQVIGVTALSTAAKAGNADIVRLFLENGALIPASASLIPDALWRGIESGNPEVVRQLLAPAVSAKMFKLLCSQSKIMYFEPEIFSLLLSYGVDSLKFDLQGEYLKATAHKALPPKFKAPYQPVANLGTLMRLGVDFDFNLLGITRLMALAASGDVDAMEREIGEENPRNMLREVTINLAKNGRMTALDYAILAGKLDAVMLLVENGAEVNPPVDPSERPDQSGDRVRWPLEHAFSAGDARIIEYLLEKGARMPLGSVTEAPYHDYLNLNILPRHKNDLMENMPLLLALEKGGYLDLFYKVAADSDTSLASIDYQTAFLIAAVQGYSDVAEFLLKNHPELASELFLIARGQEHSFGATAFVLAADFGHVSILKLMAHAVQPPEDWPPIYSQALSLAERYGNRKSAEFILQRAFGNAVIGK
jgi:ankyrin repeat protein